MSEKFSLKDHLFNPDTVGQLAAEYATGVPGFDAPRFEAEALAGFADRELMARMEWLADCLEGQLATTFPDMADQLEAAMKDPLDPTLRDDDFGHFIHALPGILAVRHGLETHRERALDLLYEATKRFSMEFYIRPFLNRWPDETLVRLRNWVTDENYHVRRLVSEGTRPKLPWAKAVTLKSVLTVPFLAQLHSDDARYVTRSVANHLNDIAKTEPELVVRLLAEWADQGKQAPKELAWMTRHALRTLVKQGHRGALALLGYKDDVPIRAEMQLGSNQVAIGEKLGISCALQADEDVLLMVDYRIRFARPGGKTAEKVFKLKGTSLKAGQTLELSKAHLLKAGATTFTWHPGPHEVVLQVNGVDLATASFDVTS
jgi:3-methyladenine DNA glycosylase AlkC